MKGQGIFSSFFLMQVARHTRPEGHFKVWATIILSRGRCHLLLGLKQGYPFKGPVTQAPITITIKMHALDWLNEHGRILRGAFQPIEGVYFYCSRYRSRYRGLCDRAFSHVCNCNVST